MALHFNVILKEYILFVFLSTGFMTICNLKKRLMWAAFCVLLQVMFMNNLRTNSTTIKTVKETPNNQ